MRHMAWCRERVARGGASRPLPCSREPSQGGRFWQRLNVHNQVVSPCAGGPQVRRTSRATPREEASRFGYVRVVAENAGIGSLAQPVDLGVGMQPPQLPQHRRRQERVAQVAKLDHQDSFRGQARLRQQEQQWLTQEAEMVTGSRSCRTRRESRPQSGKHAWKADRDGVQMAKRAATPNAISLVFDAV